jgi:4-hydroxybenzoate polyprenyltransferase
MSPAPLVVDLDETLLNSDTLFEGLLAVVFKLPHRFPTVLSALLRNRAALKREVATAVSLDPVALPYNQEVLALLKQRRAAGATTHLVTASDQKVADLISRHLGLFDSATGSDGEINNKGVNKAVALQARFPAGFGYVGDSHADIPVWSAASEVIVVRPSPRLSRSLEREGIAVDLTLDRPQPALEAWARELRIHHWSKNGLILIPLFLSQQFIVPAMAIRYLAAFLIFGLITSATYILNDLSDLTADRLHPTKGLRPLAAGVIRVRMALPVAVMMLLAALAAAFVLNRGFASIAAIYVATSLLYTIRLKTEPIIDVITIGILFCIRIVAGMVISYQPISIWLSTLTLVLFTSLALAKRNGEMVRAAKHGRFVIGRGYFTTDILLITTLGIACGTTAVLIMVLYMALEAGRTGLYISVQPLFLIPLVLFLWLVRIWVRAHRGTLTEDPVTFAIRDNVSWFYAAATVVLWMTAVFAK